MPFAAFLLSKGDMENELIAVKAVGDWTLDVLAIPFNAPDADGQWFDENTDIMHEEYKTPPGFYQHGIKQGAKALQEKVMVIAKSVYGSLKKMIDGWHIEMALDKSIPESAEIMTAAKNGRVAVSSDSIAHIARLETRGKTIMYEKNRPGRISVWPLAGISLWEIGNGNFKPASKRAFAVPAIKAIYRESGIPFPEISDGVLPEAATAAKRARIVEQSKQILKKTERLYKE